MTCDRLKNYTLDAVKLISNEYDTFNPCYINRSIASLCSNKACGIDVPFAEHMLHASPEIHVLLSICFNPGGFVKFLDVSPMIGHGHVSTSTR